MLVRRRLAALVLLGTLATGVAACGGDKDDEGANDTVELEDVDNSGANGGSAADDDDDEETTTTESSSDDSSDSGDDSSDAIEGAFSEGCGDFASIFGALGASIGGSFGTDTEQATEEFDQLIDDAPEEIQDDLETFRDAFADYAQALEDAGIDLNDPESIDPSNTEAFQVLAEAGQALATPEVTEASQNINDFIASNCGG